MDRGKVSDAQLAASGSFQGAIDRNANFRQQASNHNLGRNIRVLKLFGYMGLMRQSGISLAGTVECLAASLQDFSSSKTMTHMGLPTGPMQAAHFMPGRVRIGGKDAWQWPANPATRPHIEALFSAVEHLPLPFNQADSEAEAKGQHGGLCWALAQACTVLIRQPVSSSGPGAKVPLDMIKAGYDEWQRGAAAALTRAIGNKSAKPGLPPLVGDPFEGYTPESIAARSAPTNSQWNRDEAVRVLELYVEDQRQRTWPSMATIAQSSLQDVEMHFKG